MVAAARGVRGLRHRRAGRRGRWRRHGRRGRRAGRRGSADQVRRGPGLGGHDAGRGAVRPPGTRPRPDGAPARRGRGRHGHAVRHRPRQAAVRQARLPDDPPERGVHGTVPRRARRCRADPFRAEPAVTAATTDNSKMRTRPAAAADMASIIDVDKAAFGADRSRLLRRLPAFAGQLLVLETGRGIAGFAAAWQNHTSTVIGPVVAPDGAAARRLIGDLAAGIRGQVRLDLDPDRPELPRLGGQARPPAGRAERRHGLRRPPAARRPRPPLHPHLASPSPEMTDASPISAGRR